MSRRRSIDDRRSALLGSLSDHFKDSPVVVSEEEKLQSRGGGDATGSASAGGSSNADSGAGAAASKVDVVVLFDKSVQQAEKTEAALRDAKSSKSMLVLQKLQEQRHQEQEQEQQKEASPVKSPNASRRGSALSQKLLEQARAFHSKGALENRERLLMQSKTAQAQKSSAPPPPPPPSSRQQQQPSSEASLLRRLIGERQQNSSGNLAAMAMSDEPAPSYTEASEAVMAGADPVDSLSAIARYKREKKQREAAWAEAEERGKQEARLAEQQRQLRLQLERQEAKAREALALRRQKQQEELDRQEDEHRQQIMEAQRQKEEALAAAAAATALAQAEKNAQEQARREREQLAQEEENQAEERKQKLLLEQRELQQREDEDRRYSKQRELQQQQFMVGSRPMSPHTPAESPKHSAASDGTLHPEHPYASFSRYEGLDERGHGHGDSAFKPEPDMSREYEYCDLRSQQPSPSMHSAAGHARSARDQHMGTSTGTGANMQHSMQRSMLSQPANLEDEILGGNALEFYALKVQQMVETNRSTTGRDAPYYMSRNGNGNESSVCVAESVARQSVGRSQLPSPVQRSASPSSRSPRSQASSTFVQHQQHQQHQQHYQQQHRHSEDELHASHLNASQQQQQQQQQQQHQQQHRSAPPKPQRERSQRPKLSRAVGSGGGIAVLDLHSSTSQAQENEESDLEPEEEAEPDLDAFESELQLLENSDFNTSSSETEPTEAEDQIESELDDEHEDGNTRFKDKQSAHMLIPVVRTLFDQYCRSGERIDAKGLQRLCYDHSVFYSLPDILHSIDIQFGVGVGTDGTCKAASLEAYELDYDEYIIWIRQRADFTKVLDMMQHSDKEKCARLFMACELFRQFDMHREGSMGKIPIKAMDELLPRMTRANLVPYTKTEKLHEVLDKTATDQVYFRDFLEWFREQDARRAHLLKKLTKSKKWYARNPFATWYNAEKRKERQRVKRTLARQKRRLQRQERREAGESDVSDDSHSSSSESDQPGLLRRMFESSHAKHLRNTARNTQKAEKHKKYKRKSAAAKNIDRERRRNQAEAAGRDSSIVVSDTTIDLSFSDDESIEVPGILTRIVESREAKEARLKALRQKERKAHRKKQQQERARIRRNHDKLLNCGERNVSDTPPTTPAESSTQDEQARVGPGILTRTFESWRSRNARLRERRQMQREKDRAKRHQEHDRYHHRRERRRDKGEEVSDTPPYISFSDDYTTTEDEGPPQGYLGNMFTSKDTQKAQAKRERAELRVKNRAHRDKLRNHREKLLEMDVSESELPAHLANPIVSSSDVTSSESEDRSVGAIGRALEFSESRKIREKERKQLYKQRREAKKARENAKKARASARGEASLLPAAQEATESSSESSLSSEAKPGVFGRILEGRQRRFLRKKAYVKKARKHDHKARRKQRNKERQRLKNIRDGKVVVLDADTATAAANSSSSESSSDSDDAAPGFFTRMVTSRNHRLNEKRKKAKLVSKKQRDKRRKKRTKLREMRAAAGDAAMTDQSSESSSKSELSEEDKPGIFSRMLESRNTYVARKKKESKKKEKKEKVKRRKQRAKEKARRQASGEVGPPPPPPSSSSESELSEEETPGFFRKMLESRKQYLSRKKKVTKNRAKKAKDKRRKQRNIERDRRRAAGGGDNPPGSPGLSSSSESELSEEEKPSLVAHLLESRSAYVARKKMLSKNIAKKEKGRRRKKREKERARREAMGQAVKEESPTSSSESELSEEEKPGIIGRLMESRTGYVARKNKQAKKVAKKEKQRRRKFRNKERERRKEESNMGETPPGSPSESSESELSPDETPGMFGRLMESRAGYVARKRKEASKVTKKEKQRRRKDRAKERSRRDAQANNLPEQPSSSSSESELSVEEKPGILGRLMESRAGYVARKRKEASKVAKKEKQRRRKERTKARERRQAADASDEPPGSPSSSSESELSVEEKPGILGRLMESHAGYIARKTKEVKKAAQKEKNLRRKQRSKERARREAELAGKDATVDIPSSSESDLSSEEPKPGMFGRLVESHRHYLQRKRRQQDRQSHKEKAKRRKERTKERARREAQEAGQNVKATAVSSSSESDLTEEDKPSLFARLSSVGKDAYDRYHEGKRKRQRKEKEKRRKKRERVRAKRHAHAARNVEKGEAKGSPDSDNDSLSSTESDLTDEEQGMVGRWMERRNKANRKTHLQYLKEQKKAKKRRQAIRLRRREHAHKQREKRRAVGEENVSDTPYEPSTDEEPSLWQKLRIGYREKYKPSIRRQQKDYIREDKQQRSGTGSSSPNRFRDALRDNIDRSAFGKRTPLTTPMRMHPLRGRSQQPSDMSHASPVLQKRHADLTYVNDRLKKYGSPVHLHPRAAGAGAHSNANNVSPDRDRAKHSRKPNREERLALLRTPPAPKMDNPELEPLCLLHTEAEAAQAQELSAWREGLLGKPSSPGVAVSLSLDAFKLQKVTKLDSSPSLPPGYIDYQNVPAPIENIENTSVVANINSNTAAGETLGQWLVAPKKTKVDERNRLKIRMDKLRNHQFSQVEMIQQQKLHSSHLSTQPILTKKQHLQFTSRDFNGGEDAAAGENEMEPSEFTSTDSPKVVAPARKRRKESVSAVMPPSNPLHYL